MRHDETLAIIFRPSHRGSAEDHQRALDHVARCSDCWEIVRAVHEAERGGELPEARRMDALFACEPVRDRLHLLVGLRPEEAVAKRPLLARHVQWCHACHDRLVELEAVEREAMAGEFGPLLALEQTWAVRHDAALGTIHEIAGRIAVRLSRAVAAFASAPEGAFLVPAMAHAVRGEAPGAERAVREIRVPLAHTELSARLRLEADGEGHTGLTVEISGELPGPLSLSLRRDDVGESLLARQSVRGTDAVVLRGIEPGRYVLDIHDRRNDMRFRLPIDVDSAE